MANYKNLIAWQRSNEFALSVYKISFKLPKDEVFGLISQLRRASLSVPTNIVEGYARRSKKEFSRFLDISLSSLAEAQYLLEFACDVEYINREDLCKVNKLSTEAGKLIWSLRESKLKI